MGSYAVFTQEMVFKNEEANILCNRIFNELFEEFTFTEVNEQFAITGKLAKYIQGAGISPIVVVPFITDLKTIFEFCAVEMSKRLGAKGAVVFKNRIQMIYGNIYLEFWFVSDIGTINTISNLPVQDPADIPINIK